VKAVFFQRKPQGGLTLIEMVVTLTLIAVGASAIASLLIGGLNINQTNQGFADDLRQAESCYETILAIQETVGWTDNGGPLSSCQSGTGDWTSISEATLQGWVDVEEARNRLTSVCAVPNRLAGNLECRGREIGGAPAAQLRIAVRGSRNIGLVLPLREPDGDD